MPLIRIPLMRSTFFDEERTRGHLAHFIKTAPRLSMGEHCAAFERSLSLYQERKYSVFVSNGSTANLGLIQAMLNLGRLKKGDKVGVSAVTWATNVMPLLQLGLIPIAIDCSVSHLNVTSEELKKHIKELKALFITNALGFCGDLDVIRALCDEHGVILMEDNCESLGTHYKGKLLGNFGVASTFSFFVGHHMSTIEGGMICTDDEELWHMLVMVRAHGWDRNLPEAKRTEMRKAENLDDFHAKYMFYECAYNIRPTEIAGFLGELQMPMLQATLLKREKNFHAFHAAVARRPDLYHHLEIDHIEFVSNFAMPVVAKSADIAATAVKRFEDAGVENRPIIAGDITRHPFWKKALPDAVCPGAGLIHTNGFYLPNNPDLTDSEVKLICDLLEAKA